MAVSIGLLGPMRVERDGTEVDPGTMRQRALLTLLALDAGRAVTLEAIIDALWDQDVSDRAEVSVRSYLSNLRRVLEPDRAPRTPASVLVTSGTGDSLEVPQRCVLLMFAATTTDGLSPPCVR